MREEHRDPLRLRHMLEAIKRIDTYMEGRTQNDLDDDSLLFYGVVKNIEIIGEAAYKLTNEFKDRHPQTPWRHIVGMRHILVHDYYRVSPNEVYNVYIDDLPVLLKQIEGYVAENQTS